MVETDFPDVPQGSQVTWPIGRKLITNTTRLKIYHDQVVNLSLYRRSSSSVFTLARIAYSEGVGKDFRGLGGSGDSCDRLATIFKYTGLQKIH